ncbi:MAG: hypothetical protein ACKO37_07420 [Vampirovibrionales bacterium]
MGANVLQTIQRFGQHVRQRAREDRAVLPVVVKNMQRLIGSRVRETMGYEPSFISKVQFKGNANPLSMAQRMLLDISPTQTNSKGVQIQRGLLRQKPHALFDRPTGIYGTTLDTIAGLRPEDSARLSRRRIENGILSAYIAPNTPEAQSSRIQNALQHTASTYDVSFKPKIVGCCTHGCNGCLT